MKIIIKKIVRYIIVPFIISDYFIFRKKSKTSRFALHPLDFYPQIKDKTKITGFDRHYVYHTAWAARKVKEFEPEKHVDISSSLYFSGIASAFIPVDFYDYRPAPLHLSNLKSAHADLGNLDFESNSISSLSCMHVVEHIGLGRYGDPIDPEGDTKACTELARVLAQKGQLLFVVPIGGTARIEFNAHRIYTYELVQSLFPTLILKEFSYIPEFGPDGIQEHANPNALASEHYACGLFVFTKN